MFGDVQEAQSDPTAKQETTDHTQWDKEGKLVTVDPARRRRERERERETPLETPKAYKIPTSPN